MWQYQLIVGSQYELPEARPVGLRTSYGLKVALWTSMISNHLFTSLW